MAEAIIAGLLAEKLSKGSEIDVLNKSNQERLDVLQQRYGVNRPERVETAIVRADIVILAVKPKDVRDALSHWGRLLEPNRHLLVSVVAGIQTTYLESFMPEGVPVVRAMPNTSCTIGQSATGIAAGRWAKPEHVKLTETLFNAVGTVATLAEQHLDAVTALSGSGPAYVYYLVESMEKSGIDAGLPPDTVRKLTVQTLLGAAEMLVKTGEEPAKLREKITSPAGTTFAGLEALKARDFAGAVEAAIFAARDRAKQLGEEWAKKATE